MTMVVSAAIVVVNSHSRFGFQTFLAARSVKKLSIYCAPVSGPFF